MTKPHGLPICGKLGELAQFNRERGWQNGQYATEAAAVIESLVEALSATLGVAESLASVVPVGLETWRKLNSAQKLLSELRS